VECISFKVYCECKRKINGVAPKERWFNLRNFEALEVAISAYKQRFDFDLAGYFFYK
jgi:hypothetical protein